MQLIKRWKPPPMCSAIYFLIRKGELVYIGESGSFRNRMLTHECMRHAPVVTLVFYVPLPKLKSYAKAHAASVRRSIEAVLIQRLDPAWNAQRPAHITAGDMARFNEHFGEDVFAELTLVMAQRARVQK